MINAVFFGAVYGFVLLLCVVYFRHFIILRFFVRRTRKAYSVFAYEARPAAFYKTFCPFGVGRFIFIPVSVNYDNVFFYGCRPLVYLLSAVSVFCYGCRPLRSFIIAYLGTCVKLLTDC